MNNSNPHSIQPIPADLPETKHNITQKIGAFICEIGLEIHFGPVSQNTFLPGIEIVEGAIHADENRLKYPGDLLHEAGHLAVCPADKRKYLDADYISEEDDMGSEIAAILWSYAALNHLNLPSKVVFHSDGYRGASEWFIRNFTSGNYIGLPLLQWMGLCKKDDEAGDETEPFPHMIKWLRD